MHSHRLDTKFELLSLSALQLRDVIKATVAGIFKKSLELRLPCGDAVLKNETLDADGINFTRN